MVDVVIVGGGAAGLAALRALGRRAVVVEARSSLGGRVRGFEEQRDHDAGAAWVHGRCNESVLIKELQNVKLRDVATSNPWCDSSQVAKTANVLSQGRVVPITELDGDARRWKSTLSALNSKDISLGDRQGRHARLLELWMGASCRELQVAEFVGGSDSYGDHPGAHALVCGGMAQNLKLLRQSHDGVFLDSVVEKISYSEEKVSVSVLRNGKERIRLEARCCLLTLPLGVLKKHHLALFSPPLPDRKKRAIERLGVGSYKKIFLFYTEPWWRLSFKEKKPFLYLEKNDTDFLAFLDHDAVFQDSNFLLEATIAGDRAALFDSSADDEALTYVESMLRANFETIDKPTKTLVTNWNTDPFALGAYSFWKVGATDTDVDDLADPINNLFWAGEATSVDFQGSLTGALESGLRAARQVSDYLLVAS